ncbi:tetratricopeptide repeat protein [Streptomyces sp. NPDC056948]|uniref:tetratricopeptide repeat protein n=1 Tax=Streptomyces sp. NPDC056948 TaxID=3345975 RepID=UPI00363832B7
MSNQVRVFLSSTFTDLARERSLIHHEVAPRLEEMSRHYGLDFQFSDLRWGVTPKDVVEDRTALICLEEVTRCRLTSPELNFLVILGDRAGTRFFPRWLPSSAVGDLRRRLRSSWAAPLVELLDVVYPGAAVESCMIPRNDRPDGQRAADALMRQAERLTAVTYDGPAEEIRRALVYSLTHREILSSGALADNPGAVALLRRPEALEQAQREMRTAVSAALGRRAAAYDEPGAEFVQRCTELLAANVYEARERGTRRHYFQSFQVATASLAQGAEDRTALDAVVPVSSSPRPRVTVVVAESGRGRRMLIKQARERIEGLAPGTAVVHLDVTATPELRELHTFAAALACLTGADLSDDEVEALPNLHTNALLGLAVRRLTEAAEHDPVLVVVDGLDLVRDGDGDAAVEWLWNRPAGFEVLLGCETRFADGLTGVQVVQVDLGNGSPTVDVPELVRKAPFSARICMVFLGLCALSQFGCTEREFLGVCGSDEELRAELVDHFPIDPFQGEVPPLIWHRLRDHFESLMDEVGAASVPAVRPREQQAAAVEAILDGPLRAHCRKALMDHLTVRAAHADGRVALLLADLASSNGGAGALTTLVRTPGFLKACIAADQGDSLARAIVTAEAVDSVVTAIETEIEAASYPGTPQDLSHGLLDLSVLTRRLGLPKLSADLSLRAVDIRRDTLGAGHELTVAAVVEASDACMESGDPASAEELCRSTLKAVRGDRSLLLRDNLASALAYRGKYAEAEEMLRELAARYVGDAGRLPELASVYHSLSACLAAQGVMESARHYGEQGIELTRQFYGARSSRLGTSLVNHGWALHESGLATEATAYFGQAFALQTSLKAPGHPHRTDAEMAYFAGLVDSDRLDEAARLLAECLNRTRPDEAALWAQMCTRQLLKIAEAGDPKRLVAVLDAAERAVPRGAVPLAPVVRRYAQLVGFEGLSEVSGFLNSGLALWILTVLAAGVHGRLPRHDCADRIRPFEEGIHAVLGWSEPVQSLWSRIGVAWQHFRPDYPYRDACLRLAAEIHPELRPLLSDTLGEDVVRRAVDARAEGRFTEAAEAQAEAVEIAARLFGTESKEYATALINLGSLQFSDGRLAEAFHNYRAGLLLVLDGTAAELDRLGGSVQNLMSAGWQANLRAQTAQTLATLAERAGPSEHAINLWIFSVLSYAGAGQRSHALGGIERIVGIYTALNLTDRRRWHAPVRDFFTELGARLSGTDERFDALRTDFLQACPTESDVTAVSPTATDPGAAAHARDPERNALSVFAAATALAEEISADIKEAIVAGTSHIPDFQERREELLSIDARYLLLYSAGLSLIAATDQSGWADEEADAVRERMAGLAAQTLRYTAGPAEEGFQDMLAETMRQVHDALAQNLERLRSLPDADAQQATFTFFLMHLRQIHPSSVTLLGGSGTTVLTRLLMGLAHTSLSASRHLRPTDAEGTAPPSS